MSRSALIIAQLGLGLVACVADPSPPSAPANRRPPASATSTGSASTARAERLHRQAFVLDAHADTLMRTVDEGFALARRSDTGHVDLPRLAEGGVDGQVFAVWVDPAYPPGRAARRALAMIDSLLLTIERHPGRIGLARTATEARVLAERGRLAAFIGVEGGEAIENDLSILRTLHRLGASYLTLTWWGPNALADGSGEKPRWDGLGPRGREVVRELNRLHMMVDVSHASDDTFFDVLALTRDPVIASHSGARAVCPHHRNLSDEMLRALAKNGGVVGINFYSGFLDADYMTRSDRLRERLKPELEAISKRFADRPGRAREERWAFLKAKARDELPEVPLGRVVDHIDHVVRVAGVDHVGLGSDFDGFSFGPKELVDASRLPLLTAELVRRGYADRDVEKILGGNFLRVFEEVLERR